MSDKRRWTPAQESCIGVRGGSVLVCAAAGSGKTSVLVERVIRRITDEENPVDINRLLIVTFTKAAAAEMRERIAGALQEKVRENPEDKRLGEQLILLPGAVISTIDGFCASLLREQADRSGLPPRFSVAEDGQTKLLSAQALDTVLEEAYTAKEPAFLQLAELLADKNNDDTLRKGILKAVAFMSAQEDPQGWLQTQVDAYRQPSAIEDTPWMQTLREQGMIDCDHFLSLTEEANRLAQLPCLEGVYLPALAEDRVLGERCRKVLETGTYKEITAFFSEMAFARLYPFHSKDPVALEIKSRLTALRESAKKLLKDCAGLFSDSVEELREDLQALAPAVEALGNLISRYNEEFTRLKRQKKCLDFVDLEHEALKLLVDSHGNPTPLARELSARYEEIMVDEYQDTNGIQDALFRALSRQETNLFRVGDVKQSIYGFRQAMPSIFTGHRDRATDYREEKPRFPASVTLDANFRSRKTVTETVNFLFRQLMHRSLGGVEYDEKEALTFKATYPPAEDRQTEWIILDNAQTDKPPAKDVAQARAIGEHIRRLLTTMTVQDKGEQRPLEYGDIAILLRSCKGAEAFVKTLNAMGIPTGLEGSGSLLDTAECRTALSFLRVVDNPLLDVEITAVMLSALYGFTPDEVALLRTQNKDIPLYVAVDNEAVKPTPLGERCRHFMNDLRRARALAVSLPADELLERIYRETGLTAVFSARPGGAQRVANLHRLDGVARSFEQGEYRGLSAFIRYIDKLQEQKATLSCANTVTKNAVHIMTVHGSKGLEFPVVFLARLEKPFNTNDAREQLLFHHEAGIGMKMKGDGEKHTPLPFKAVLQQRKSDERGEELRIWYVALTRAKEKLFCVMSVDNWEKKTADLQLHLPLGRDLPTSWLMKAGCPGDWLLMASLRHPSFLAYRQDSSHIPSLPCDEDFSVEVVTPQDSEDAENREVALHRQAEAEPSLSKQLQTRLAYTYPYNDLKDIPAGMAASALSHEDLERQHIAQKKPAFLQKGGLSPEDKGTALHTFMQFADFANGETHPAEESLRLVKEGLLTHEQQSVLPFDRISAFFASDLYKRMKASSDCRREYRFMVNIPASQVEDTPHASEETVTVQGIADCIFRENGRWILVDYKTDRIANGEELTKRYYQQMAIYYRALTTILREQIGEILLYSFHLGKPVSVPLPTEKA